MSPPSSWGPAIRSSGRAARRDLIAPIWLRRGRRSLLSDGWAAVRASYSQMVAVGAIIVPPVQLPGSWCARRRRVRVPEPGLYGCSGFSRTAEVFGWLMFSLMPEILFVPLATLFVIRGDSVFPMKVAVANGVLNVGLDCDLRVPSPSSRYRASTALYIWGALCGVLLRGSQAVGIARSSRRLPTDGRPAGSCVATVGCA